MAPDDNDPDVRELRERVSELETDKQKLRARLDDQQETIQTLMPSRRQTLAGLGLLSAGGVAGRLSSGTAKAEAAGQVGTATDPVDVQAWDLNVQNSVTSDLPMGGNDVTDVGAMDVERTDIAGIPINKIDDFTNSDTTDSEITATFDGLDQPGRYGLFFSWNVRDDTSVVEMTVADDGGSTYGYRDESGTFVGGQNAVEIADPNATNATLSGWITLRFIEHSDGDGGFGANNEMDMTPPDRWDGYFEKGGTENYGGALDNLHAVELSFPGAGADSYVEIWEVI